jgi:hypothetical protein
MSTRPPYLEIKCYWRFQHYRTRGAPWIKLYATLLSDPEFLQLPEAAQAQLMKLWLLASQLGHPLPNRPRLLAGKIGTTGKFHLATLIDAGFLIPSGAADASTTLAQRDDGASTTLAQREDDASKTLAENEQEFCDITRARIITENREEREREENVITTARARLSVAANQGLAEHPTRPETIPRIHPGAGGTLDAVNAIRDAGIPLEFAEAVIYDAAKSHHADGRISSLKYFVPVVLRAWEEHQAAIGVATSPTPRPISSRRGASNAGLDSYAAGRAAFEKGML